MVRLGEGTDEKLIFHLMTNNTDLHVLYVQVNNENCQSPGKVTSYQRVKLDKKAKKWKNREEMRDVKKENGVKGRKV